MSLVNTRIQNMRSGSNMDKNETRPSRYGALNLFMTQTDAPTGIITPELKAKAEQSIGSTLEVPVINYDAGVTIGNTRNLVIADDENTSAMHQITFATFAWGFTMTPATFLNNEIGLQRDFEEKMNKYIYKFGAALDTACISALEAAKTQVIGDPLNYPVVANTLEAPWKLRENVLGDLEPIMASNDHFAGMHVLGNGGMESILNNLQKSGLYNAENKQFEYMNKTFHFSTRVSNEVDDYASMFAVQEGSVGIMTRFERESLLGTISRTGHEWGIDRLPLLNFPVGTYYYESVGDYSGIAGASTADMDRARKEHYGFAVDVAIITNYNSDPSTIANPIIKTVVKGETVADALNVAIVNETTNPVYTQEVV